MRFSAKTGVKDIEHGNMSAIPQRESQIRGAHRRSLTKALPVKFSQLTGYS